MSIRDGGITKKDKNTKLATREGMKSARQKGQKVPYFKE